VCGVSDVLASDELTGSEIAATFGAHVGLSARYEALPVDVLAGQDDLQKMFRWFADTPAYQADIAAVRRIDLRSGTCKRGCEPRVTAWPPPRPEGRATEGANYNALTARRLSLVWR
jgi:hypothetical protein